MKQSLPTVLQAYPYYCLWRSEDEPGRSKPSKVPYKAKSPRYRADPSNTEDFTSFDITFKQFQSDGTFTGIGIGLFGDMSAVDIDDCVDEDGKLSEMAQDFISTMGSYWEYSPSGKGVHIIFLTPDFRYPNSGYYVNNKNIGLEVYVAGHTKKYISVTGTVPEGSSVPVRDCSEKIGALLDRYMKRPVAEPIRPPVRDVAPLSLSADQIVEKAKQARNGHEFTSLFQGDWPSTRYNSQSEADLAFCNHLAFWCGCDFNMMDQIFRSSGLFREKWDRRQTGSTYGALTIEKAILGCRETYNPNQGKTDAALSTKPIAPPVEEDPDKADAQRREYLLTSAANQLDELRGEISSSRPAVQTGFYELDSALDGGLYKGLYILGAISSLGKTTFLLQIADQIAGCGNDVLFFSLEMSKFELMAKSISRLTFKNCEGKPQNAKTTRGILAGTKWKHYSEAEKSLIDRSMSEYGEFGNHIYIHEGVGDLGVTQVRAEIEKHIEITGNVPIVIIDYLQILAPFDMKASDKQNTDKSVLELKRISRDTNSAIIAISSFNRENYTSPVNLASFKESGAIEYSSDVLLGLQLAGMDDLKAGEGKKTEALKQIEIWKSADPRKAQLKILKGRNGKTGLSLFYEYYPMFNYFEEILGEKEWSGSFPPNKVR